MKEAVYEKHEFQLILFFAKDTYCGGIGSMNMGDDDDDYPNSVSLDK